MANKQPGNVVRINEHTAFTRRFTPAGAAALLHDCKERVLERIAVAVARSLDNVDDALFALADKAANDVQQSRYFDAMREVRLKRGEIEETFKRAFNAAAEGLIAPRADQPAHPDPVLPDAGLSLVEHDDLEETLAISTLSDKLEALCHAELFALRERVRFLLDRDTLDAASLPMGPKTLCGAFKAACAVIESGVDVKIIVFKLFDRYVCEVIALVYHELNDQLAGNGVLPKIATRVGNGQHIRALNGLPYGMSDDSTTAEPDFLAAVAQILAGVGNVTHGGVALATPAAATPLLLQDLTLLQQGHWETLTGRGITVDPALLAGGTANVVRLLKDNAQTEQGDGMVMEVVALLFDYLFDNAGIPDRAKALIGRLQIPTLKVAMLDKSFFSKRHHPARRLLNTLAHATVGLPAEGDGEIFRHLEACINKVQMEFDSDIAVFEAALSELEAQLDHQDARLSENVAEARKLIEGRERLKIAESLVEAEIEKRLHGKAYPEFVRTFAFDRWKNLLLVAYMKDGREGDAWKTRLETLDLLIWSTLPKSSLKDKRQLVAMLPGLLATLEKGMKLLALEEHDQNEFLERLANCHARVVQETTAEPARADSGLRVSQLPEEPRGHIGKAITAPAAPSTRQLGGMMVEDITLLGGPAPEREGDREDAQPRLLSEIDPFALKGGNAAAAPDDCAELVSKLVPGVWLEFDHQGEKCVERLSWISAILGSYLFTDRDGMKTRELGAEALATLFREGRAAVADDMSLLVDRSLSALLDDLQRKVAG